MKIQLEPRNRLLFFTIQYKYFKEITQTCHIQSFPFQFIILCSSFVEDFVKVTYLLDCFQFAWNDCSCFVLPIFSLYLLGHLLSSFFSFKVFFCSFIFLQAFSFLSQFLCCQNIKLFLDTCKAHYGIKDSDLFEPTMLYDLTNFHRVLITLAKLSQCRKVQQLHPDIL